MGSLERQLGDLGTRQSVSTTRQADGSLAGTLPGPAAVTLPTLSGWRFRFETPEAQPFYNDSTWTLADHPTTTNPTPPVTTPVLYADDYGFHHGFIWYRGHFHRFTGDETGIHPDGKRRPARRVQCVAERRLHRL